MTKKEARKIFLSWDQNTSPVPSYDSEYNRLRTDLNSCFEQATRYVKENDVKKREYITDLNFGVNMFVLLKEKYNFTPREASNSEIWNYISMKVIPDIIYERWGYNEGRFFSRSNRTWLKTMWWYIYLSWIDNQQETYNILKDFTTDEIVQLVERSGPHGYRMPLTREIMRQFSTLDESSKRKLFRKVMKLNTARVKSVEPALIPGGYEKYVKELIEYFYEPSKPKSNTFN
ncbi:DUF6339 family protein [Guptibacillus sedimenti]|uniref:DUF6339 family protein n=1 Tax=Guptibacillus sedimenti TaxID=3025680 RepID=UPI0023603305|nr:DUF6339 family protein [Pseudalkalibacillus sedimenti]